jgi:hypothetical protein
MTRCLRIALLALAISLTTCSVVSGAAKKPKAPKVQAAFVDGQVGNGKIPVTVTLSFSPPAGKSAAKFCKGKIALSAKIGSKKKKIHGKSRTVPVYVKKSASIKSVDGRCGASAALSIPSSFAGKSVKIKHKFTGNKTFGAWSRTSSHKVVAQAPPDPTPGGGFTLSTGSWHMISNDAGSWYWTLTVGTANDVTTLRRWNNNNLTCPGHPGVQILGANAGGGPDPEKVKWTSLPFAINSTDVNVASSWSSGVESATLSLKLHMVSASYFTGTFRIDGQFSTDGGVHPCTSGDIEVTGGQGDVG